MARKLWICPICDGAGDSPHCPCHGEGLISEEEAADWQRMGEVIRRLPEPPTGMDAMCHDCAFRKSSPERESFGAWPGIEHSVQTGVPFICHQGMHVTSDGRYIPLERDARGMPVGHPACAGWEAARAKIATERNST